MPPGSSDSEPDATSAHGEQARRWFRQPATLVSAFALLVSLTSTVVTIENNRSQAQNAKRDQLLTLVDSLAQAPQEQSQIDTTYKNDLQTRLSVGGAETTAELIQAEQAAQLIDSLHDNMAASEAYEVANSFSDRGEPSEALRYYGVAIRRAATDPLVLAGAYRGEAGMFYNLGRLPQAAAAITHAYQALSARQGFSTVEVNQNRIFTDLYDLGPASGAHACKRSAADLADAVKLTATLNKSSASFAQDSQRELTDLRLVHSC